MKVRYTVTASADTAELLARIAADNSAAARAVAAAIKAAVDRLAVFPRIGALTDMEGVCMRIARPYRYLIFYSIVKDDVFVLRVRHPARRREIA
jgi:plasmid stabilization system protein ParE